jgi:hypothetical protein
MEINITAGSSDNDITRYDETWTDNNEHLAREWMGVASNLSERHNRASIYNKNKHYMTGLPAILLPTIFAPITATFSGYPNIDHVSVCGFIATAIFSGIHSFFNYNIKYQRHLEYSARYMDIVTDIQYELAKKRKFRIEPDVFLTKIQLKLDNLAQNSPDVNKF